MYSQVRDMTPCSDSASCSNTSGEMSPIGIGRLNGVDAAKAQACPFLQLPNDIFKCVLDYLDRDAAWSLKRLCKAMLTSSAVDELLYRYPIQLNEIKDIRLADWKYKYMGRTRWIKFQVCLPREELQRSMAGS